MDYNENATIGEVINAMTKEKKDVFYYVVGLYLAIAGPEKEELEDKHLFWSHGHEERKTFYLMHSIHGAYWLAHMISKQKLDILKSFDNDENMVINYLLSEIVQSNKYRYGFPKDVQALPYTTSYSADDVCSITMIIPPN